MDKVLERLKEELEMFGEDQLMITVKRSDLSRLVDAYEKETGRKPKFDDERW